MGRLTRSYPLFEIVLLLLLAALAYGTLRRLDSHEARPSQATAEQARALADSQGGMSLYIADPNADVGPGCDEAAAARHPSP